MAPCGVSPYMENFYARSVFFVKDGEASLTFYTQTLGFALDWNNQYEGRASVFQVSLFGFELILNQVYSDTRQRAGHGGFLSDWKTIKPRHCSSTFATAVSTRCALSGAADPRAP